jgi:PAS domain S-box-containing protein
MINRELRQLEKITNALTTNGYLVDRTKEWEYTFNAMADAIFVVNLKYQIKFANTRLLNLLGLTKAEILNKHCSDVLRPKDKHCACDNDSNLEEVCDFGAHCIEGLDGWFNFTRSPIFSDSGKLLGFICQLRDVKSCSAQS